MGAWLQPRCLHHRLDRVRARNYDIGMFCDRFRTVSRDNFTVYFAAHIGAVLLETSAVQAENLDPLDRPYRLCRKREKARHTARSIDAHDLRFRPRQVFNAESCSCSNTKVLNIAVIHHREKF